LKTEIAIMWRTDTTNFPFKNNVPDPLLSGKELPTFKFALEQSRGKILGGSFGKEATVEELPISKGIAGVSMRLEPGVTRELHWHATAAEWAFVLEGRVRTIIVDPSGGSEINEFEPGDIWYFPRGNPHVLSCLGEKACHFILIFDNGYFSELGTFSITDWLGHTPKALLAKNFGLPETTFDGFPREEAYFVRGRIPPDQITTIQGALASPPATHKYRLLAQEPHSIHRFGREWRVGANRFPISQTITGVILDLDPGGLRELHWHPNADEWQYVIEGQFSVSMFGSHGRYRIETLAKGNVGYIPQGYGHSIENIASKPGRMLIGLNTGEYQAIDLSQWTAANPPYLLADHFGKPEDIFAKFPKSRAFISPPDGQRKREIK
jgi:oxalate decarboxylase